MATGGMDLKPPRRAPRQKVQAAFSIYKNSITRLTTRLEPCLSPEQTENTDTTMVPLYAARIEDLGPGDFVKARRAAEGSYGVRREGNTTS
jgi:hypothetical protein